LPIPLGAKDLSLQSAYDVWLAIITARLSGGDGHRPRDLLARITKRSEVRAEGRDSSRSRRGGWCARICLQRGLKRRPILHTQQMVRKV
jgi:hypothetical protein